MSNKLFPQLRILVTDFCDSKCIYCRPTGESNLCSSQRRMSIETARKIAEIYRKYGGTEIKISGGDPAFWPYLVEFVAYLKTELKFQKVEVITRSVRINTVIVDLIEAGLDVLNFSLDTTNQEEYQYITKKTDFIELITTIKKVAGDVFCKINMVVMNGVNDRKWKEMISFCEATGIKQLKLLDYIDDLSGELNEKDSQEKYYYSFESICDELSELYGAAKIIYQGGLGHPMNSYMTQKGLNIICKNSENGAWYSKECESCNNFPCHDALMALRVTPSDCFQLCLLNESKNWYFDENNMESQFSAILQCYENAYFIGDKQQ